MHKWNDPNPSAQTAINKLVKSHGGLMTTEYVAEAFFRFVIGWEPRQSILDDHNSGKLGQQEACHVRSINDDGVHQRHLVMTTELYIRAASKRTFIYREWVKEFTDIVQNMRSLPQIIIFVLALQLFPIKKVWLSHSVISNLKARDAPESFGQKIFA